MNNRPVASLTPTLLARKGAARPAMRPQLQPLRAFQDNAARQLEDLGWNDMGANDADANDVGTNHPDARHMAAVAGTPPRAESPAPAAPVEAKPVAEVVALNPASEPVPHVPPVPEVVRQQEAAAVRLAKPRRSALSEGRRAAFTLRLDAERHLKLRLASVTRNRSAQQLVTEALDRLIAELPEVEELAAKVRKGR